MAGVPEVEALEAEETEEELNIDELTEALEATKKTRPEVEDEPTDKTGEEASEEVPEEKPEDDSGGKPEKGAEEVPEKKTPEEDPMVQENRELRQLLREQKREIATMQAKLQRIEKGITESEDYDGEPPKLSKIEELQAHITKIGQDKGAIFEVLVDAMEVNPKFADVREVCTRENFDDIFEELGRALATERGGNPLERQLEIEAEIWAMPNPYKYMYGIIKQYHPRYAEQEKATATPKDKVKLAKKVEPVQAPTSLASVGGGDQDTKSGWTAKRIDSLPEDELEKVPREVYDKYLRGELD